MAKRPKLAVMIAHCITQWSEVEIHLGALLTIILHANEKAAMAMYAGVENRAAQLRLIDAAAEASLPTEHYSVISMLLTTIVRPATKERDRLAHWVWGYTDELPDALLIAEPEHTLKSLMEVLNNQHKSPGKDVPVNFDKIHVVREGDLIRTLKRFWIAKDNIRLAMGTAWELNTPTTRAELLRQLSNVPEIRAGLIRQAEARQKTQATPQPSPPQDQNGGS